MVEFWRYLSLVFRLGFAHWDKGEFLVTLSFLVIAPIIAGFVGLSLQFSTLQWAYAVVGVVLFDIAIIIPTKIGIRYMRLTTPRLRIEVEKTPENTGKAIWWHLIVHNDSNVPIDGCYAQLLSFTPNISNRPYQLISLPWSSWGG